MKSFKVSSKPKARIDVGSALEALTHSRSVASSSSVDETMLPCLHVMVSNLHACVAQSCWVEF